MRAGLRATAVLAAVLGAGASQGAEQQEVQRLETRRSAEVGQYLIDGRGRTLYRFTKDTRGEGGAQAKSNCRNACATAWPPALADAPPAAAEGAKPGKTALIPRDGKQQVTYDGWPLYHFVGDAGQGQATGQGVEEFGGTWHLVATGDGSGTPADPFARLDLKGPECVRHDPERHRYLVSNINGKMRGADDNGFISRVAPDGMADLKWIAGGRNRVTLNAPKGMQLSDGTLYVADIDHLRMFDAKTGAPKGAVAIEGARFLNDMTIAEDGIVYLTDSGTKDAPGAVYRVDTDGSYRAIAEGRDLHRPNGIDFDPQGRLIVVTFAADEVMTMSTEGEILDRTKLGAGQLDGLVVREDGTRLVSSWKGKHVVRLSPDGQAETLLTGLTQPACFDVDAERGLLLVPEVKKNRVTVAPLPAE